MTTQLTIVSKYCKGNSTFENEKVLLKESGIHRFKNIKIKAQKKLWEHNTIWNMAWWNLHELQKETDCPQIKLNKSTKKTEQYTIFFTNYIHLFPLEKHECILL